MKLEVSNWLPGMQLFPRQNPPRKSLQEIRHILDSSDRIANRKSRKGLAAFTIAKLNYSGTVWAKGTGYGVGSYLTASSRKTEQVLKRKEDEEVKVIKLLNSLTNLMKPQPGEEKEFPAEVEVLLKESCLIPLMSGYLRNESVLDIGDHIPLYRVILVLLSTVATVPQYQSLLISDEGDSTISKLLGKMKETMTDYSKLLQVSQENDSELVKLFSDIDATAHQVEVAVKGLLNMASKDLRPEILKTKKSTVSGMSLIAPRKAMELRYVDEMKKLQFAFIEMIGNDNVFKVPYHFASHVHLNKWRTGPMAHARAKRVAQESITLSTSLPLSYGSTIFLRCDIDRLDVMKVLIIGPAGTPYCNGCFEFDIHFPPDYPNSPPMVNLQTTGGNRIRFNPNLYESGNVCLSILNTWGGSPEEKWNPKMSSLLPVLVAIQSLVMVDEPYWNEPGYETLSWLKSERKRSREYNANIRYCTLDYAILQQINNPPPCFKDVIERHFWMKREEVLTQCDEWEKMSYEKDSSVNRALLEQTVSFLKSKLRSMSPPEGLEDFHKSHSGGAGTDFQVIQPKKNLLKTHRSRSKAAAAPNAKGKAKGEIGQCCLQ